MANPNPSNHQLRSILTASLAKLQSDIEHDPNLTPEQRNGFKDALERVATSIHAQTDADTNKTNVVRSVSNVLDRIAPVFTRSSLQKAKTNAIRLANAYKAASEARRLEIERAAGRVTDLEFQHLKDTPGMSYARPSIDSSVTRSTHGSGSGGSSNTSSVRFNSGNHGSYDSLAPQAPPSLSYGRHPNPSTKSVNKDSANFTRVHDDGGAYPSAQRPRARSIRSLFQGSTTSLASPSASYSHHQQPYDGQVPPVPQMPSLSPYSGMVASPYGPGPNNYPANPSRTSLMPAPGQPYASTQSLQGQYYAPPAQGYNPALASHQSLRNIPGMAPQQLYGQALDPRDPNFDDPSRQHRLINEYNQPTSKKDRHPKH